MKIKQCSQKWMSYFALTILFLTTLACGFSSNEVIPTFDPNQLQTSIAGTFAVAQLQTLTANAPINTPTPRPTSTSIPRPTQDSYEILISEKFSDYIEAILDVAEYNQQATNDISLMFDNKWKTELGFALGTLNFRADEMARLKPTSRYVNAHSIIVKLANETYLFTDAYAKGIDNLDTVLIDKAIQHLINIHTLIEEATNEIDKIKAAS